MLSVGRGSLSYNGRRFSRCSVPLCCVLRYACMHDVPLAWGTGRKCEGHRQHLQPRPHPARRRWEASAAVMLRLAPAILQGCRRPGLEAPPVSKTACVERADVDRLSCGARAVGMTWPSRSERRAAYRASQSSTTACCATRSGPCYNSSIVDSPTMGRQFGYGAGPVSVYELCASRREKMWLVAQPVRR